MRVSAFYFRLCSHHDTSSTGLVGILHALYTIYISTCREIRSLDILHKSFGIDIVVVDISAASVNHLSEVVCRNIRRHTHGDTVTAVHEQVRNLCRHDGRFNERVVEVVHHVNRIFVEVVHNVLSHLGESAFRISHGGSRVAVHATEVTLSVNKRITHIPILCHSHESSVYRAVAVWVILSEHLTYYAGTFLVWFVTCVSDTHHTKENSSMHGLEAVSHIWQGTSHNNRHGIVDVRRLHLFLNIDFENSVLVNCVITVH